MRRLLLAAIVLVLIVGAVFYFAGRRETTGAAALQTSTALAPGTPAAETVPAPAPSTTDDGAVGLASVDSKSDDRASAAPAAGAADVVRVRGTVRVPSGCADPRAEVLSLSRATTIDEYVAVLAKDAEVASETDPDPDPDDGERDADGELKVLGRAPIDESGRFEIALERGRTAAHLLVVGDYWFSRTAIEATATRDAAIPVECGARLEVELVLPPQLAARSPELDALRVTARPTVGGASNDFRNFGGERRVRVQGGRVSFAAIDPRLAWEVDGVPAKLAAFHATVNELVPGRTTKISVPVAAGGSVRGVVRAKDVLGIAQAKIVARRPGRFFGFDSRVVRETSTGADGSFELAAVAPGKISLVASAPGRMENEPQKLEVADGATITGLEIVLDVGSSIAGVVTWPDGSPAAGVDVEADLDINQRVGMNAFNARRGLNGKTRSGEDGHFEIVGLGSGPFVLSAHALPKAAEAELETYAGDKTKRRKELEVHARVEGIKAGVTDAKIELSAPFALAGRVVDSLGAPIAKFRVRAQESGGGMLGDIGREKIESPFEDEKGAFRLAVPRAGKWKVKALADGCAEVDPIEIAMPRGEADGELVLALEKQCVISGVVRDTDGSTVADADVRTLDGKPGFLRGLQGPGAAGTAKSDGEGRFRMDRLKAGHVVVVADAKDRAQSVETALDLAVGEERGDVVLVLRLGGTLSGEVYEDGKALAGYLVQTTEVKSYAQSVAFTDGEGRFRVEHLEPGGYQVVALPSSGDDANVDAAAMMSKMKMATADVREGEESHVVLGAKPASPVKLHGRVTHAGEPYSGATLSFMAAGKNAIAALKIAQVGGEGAYDVQLDKPGDYIATVQRFGSTMNEQAATEYSCSIPEQAEYELDFAIPTGRISGRVKGPDGEPASGVRVSVLSSGGQRTGTMWGGQYHELATDAEGRYDAQALDAGKYTLAVGGMQLGGIFGAGSSHGRELRDVSVGEGEWQRDVDFRLKAPATVELTVEDESGSPVADAAVFARDERGQILDRFSLLSTDPSGVAKYGGLAPGKYFFSARKDARASAESALVAVEAGQSKTARVVLVAATKLLVKITDDGKPARARLSVVDSAGREHAGVFALADLQEMFAQDGFQPNEMRVGPLAPGKYVVRATSAEGKSADRSLSLSGAAEKKLSLELR